MDIDGVFVIVYVEKQLWDRFIILFDGLSWNIVQTKGENSQKNYSCGDIQWSSPAANMPIGRNGKEDYSQKLTTYKVSVEMNGHALSYFVKLLKILYNYRKMVMLNLRKQQLNCHRSYKEHSIILLRIQLVDVDQQIIDLLWNNRIRYLVAEQCELGHAMSWLSTLGGAFSALGDYYTRCAEIAGQLSVQQLKIALRLGDPNTVARCHLYCALSLMQTGHLRQAKHIIWRQYQAIKSGEYGQEPDVRLIRMCHGVWAKLRYEYKQRRYRKHSPKPFHWKTSLHS